MTKVGIVGFRNNTDGVVAHKYVGILTLILQRGYAIRDKLLHLVVYDVNHTVGVVRIVYHVRLFLNDTDERVVSHIEHLHRVDHAHLCTIAVEHGEIENGVDKHIVVILRKIELQSKRLYHVSQCLTVYSQAVLIIVERLDEELHTILKGGRFQLLMSQLRRVSNTFGIISSRNPEPLSPFDFIRNMHIMM